MNKILIFYELQNHEDSASIWICKPSRNNRVIHILREEVLLLKTRSRLALHVFFHTITH